MRTEVIAADFSAITDAASGGAWVTDVSGAGELGGGAEIVGETSEGDEGDDAEVDDWLCRAE
jgi:hypothetical protein